VQIIRGKAELRAAVAELRAAGAPVALVPTMGALHAGHAPLDRRSAAAGRQVVASIFVNPLQFGANEDLANYPRREGSDVRLLEEEGCAILWAPDAATMYPDGFATNVRVAGVSEGLCGAARPGHFDGVATVVTKLLGQVQPDIALFGEKDYQQLAVIRRLVEDLDLGVEIVGVPTERDVDGLALSSRNAYLTEEERAAARALPRALGEAAQSIIDGAAPSEVLDRARTRLQAAGFSRVDYFELRDAASLAPLDTLDRPARLLAAAHIGRTRLIDNLTVEPREP
jgi:pantoate--beta-alanine ligase